MHRREFLAAAGAVAGAAVLGADPAGSETLYNGIELPSPWPPKFAELPRDPVTPPYLKSWPAVIPIDVGRQLLVDDFLVEETTLQRTFHTPKEHADNPLVRPDKDWEKKGKGGMAMVFSDGVWYDPKDRLYKMWYLGGYGAGTCYATSQDGLKWEKPELDVRKGTNIVQSDTRDSCTVWFDLEEKDPKRRYKLFRSHGEAGRFGLSVYFSEDGVHWGERVLRTGSCGDRTTVFWNPFRKVWVYSLRHGWGQPRKRRYWEVKDILKGAQWERIDEPPLWCGSDRFDPQRDDLKTVCELYNLDCVAYESLLLGLFSIWRGDKNLPPGRPKPNEVCVGFSRDSWHWHRPERKPFLAVSEKPGDWNWGNVQSAGGCCLVVGDQLWFYHSGRAGSPEKGATRDTGGSTGLAVLRRDGFASLDAGKDGGTLTTRPVRFAGKHLFVNADVPDGELTAEVLDERGQVVAGLARADCVPARADKTLQAVTWKDGDLAKVAGKTVKFRFHLKDGRLFAFWVSPDKSGASHGYVAAGGPGLTGPLDTVGRPAT
ncbi:MAG TPA: hypothetical protein VKA46_09130 [Gemmataceae bacterium]|nr:hypothetical protein [Gemmataceae bacterium]